MIKVNGVDYKVIESKTADEKENQGHQNTARVMRENGIQRQIIAQRSHGKKFYQLNEMESGNYRVLAL